MRSKFNGKDELEMTRATTCGREGRGLVPPIYSSLNLHN